MAQKPPSKQSIIKAIVLILAVAIFLSIPVSLPGGMGAIDFRPYWSSSFLFARGQDFSNSDSIFQVEKTLTGWDENYTMSAWFAPTGNLVLAPFTLLPFTQAAYYWLLINVVVVFSSALLLWRNVEKYAWVALAITFGFSATLLSLIFGQVNTLVLFGLALFLFFNQTGRGFAAGASLALTTVKPHLVVLTLPLLLLDVLYRRQWRLLGGFVATLGVCALLMFLLNPLWPVSFWQVVTSGMGSFREAPSLPGVLVANGNSNGKWLWLVALLAGLVIWWFKKESQNQRILIDVSVMIGLVVLPIGWSYDQIMLLLPLLHVAEWGIRGMLPKSDALVIAIVLIVANLFSFYQRTLSLGDVWFVWVPVLVLLVYLFAWKRTSILAEKPE